MNRHTSNPFLAGWDEDEGPTKETIEQLNSGLGAGASSDALCDSNPPKSADRRLYKRNMSSFDAASLQLEQQQSGQYNDLTDQTDIIAKMTADFQSAIKVGDKDFEPGDPTFDPFETIMDDDVSLPSPALSLSQPNKAAEALEISSGNFNTRDTHDSIDNDDEELVSTPVRNIKSSSPRSAGDQSHEFDSDTKPENTGVPLPADKDENTNSIEKASMFASLLASAESSGKTNLPDCNLQENCHDAEDAHTIPIEQSTHIIKAPSASRDGNIDRPIGFFDPFETVIDKDALTSLMNDCNQSDQSKSKPHEVDSNETTKDLQKEQCQLNNQSSASSLHQNTSNKIGDSTSVETVVESAQPDSSVNQAKDDLNKQPIGINLTQPVEPKTYSYRTPKKAPKKKPSFQEDSSDSSEDDDRIQIVIRTKPRVDSPNSNNPCIVPLLPPPPSKSSIKQARERGQVDDMPSPVMSYKNRHDIEAPSQAGKVEDLQQPTNVARKRESLSSKDRSAPMSESDNENKSDDQEQEDRFVIKMDLSEDNDNYAKPETPLYDEDTSYVLEEFPAKYTGSGWDMMLRYPPKKKLTSSRFWKKIYVKLAQVPIAPDCKTKSQNAPTETPLTCLALQIFDKLDDKKPMQEIPIQATYTVSDISSQQLDQFGKIFTIKLQYIFYKERVGIRQGQLSRFIHTGRTGTSTTSGGHGVDPLSIGAIKKVGAPIEHSPQISQIIKLGCTNYDDIKQFKNCLEDYLFKMPINRDRALSTYKTEEVQMAVRDETYIEINQVGTITKQLARVRLFFLSFLNGTPTVEVGINAMERQGREIVGRMDILPVDTEEWIRLEAWDLHSTVAKETFEDPDSRLISLVPPDATFFELMRFRVRPPRCRELPLQVSADLSVTRTKVTINCEVMVPGCVSRKHGQIPCENIAIRIYIPECWIYFFREEKHFRMGSKKSVNRRAGKVKGIERFLGGGGLQDINDESSLIEVTSGQAKYEHHHHSIVWRAARWPKESQSAYVQNTMKIRLPLTAYDKMPESFYEYVHVEYTMPATSVSHTTLRSISVNPCDDDSPEKYVKYSAKYEYKVKIRQFINLSLKPGEAQVETSPIVIAKQPDLNQDLQREEDSDDDLSDEEHASRD